MSEACLCECRRNAEAVLRLSKPAGSSVPLQADLFKNWWDTSTPAPHKKRYIMMQKKSRTAHTCSQCEREEKAKLDYLGAFL